MNHCVPDFEMDDDYSIPSTLTRPKKSPMAAEDDIMELLWQNGQVVVQSQNQRSVKKSHDAAAVIRTDQSAPNREISSSHHHHHQQQQQQHQDHHLFMQEDEMASWLHYPLNDTNFDTDFCADLLYPPPCATSTTTTATAAATTTTTTAHVRANHVTESRPPPPPNATAAPIATAATTSRPPIPPPRRTDNFMYFSRHKARDEAPGPSNPKGFVVRESTTVDSSETPAVRLESRGSGEIRMATEGPSDMNNRFGTMNGLGTAAAGTSSAGGTRDLTTCEMTVTSSSPGGSSASAEPAQKPIVEDRKRKGREADDECQSEDVELEFLDAKKQSRGSTSTKRSRAAEVHNLSERRRRDRINEKMKALQELIPRCNKSDKASMLDEAIEYLKSLQLQVQMMSMGCGMVPMMFPGVQQYMGMGMGMGMGMEMGMSRPMMPYPNVLAGSPLPTPGAAAHLGPRFPMPAYHMQPVPGADPSRVQGANHSEHMLTSFPMQNPNQPQITNFVDPYQQYLALHQMQLPLPQNQTMAQPSGSKPGTSKGAQNPENHPSG